MRVNLDLEGLHELARFFCRVIDFRSRFTATHANGSFWSGLSHFGQHFVKALTW